MIVSRSWLPVGILALSSVAFVGGCRKDEPPAPTAETAKGPNAANKAKVNLRNNPLGNMRIDPQAMKDYRIDVCHYGTYALNQAKDAYFASLGKDEPSEKKIPSFGIPGPAAANAPGAASGAPSAGPKAPPKPAPAPPAPSVKPADGGAADAAAPMPAPDRKPDIMLRAPHERNARACTAAIALKEPAMGDVDAAVAAFAAYAVELAKDISTANQYYQREEYKKDAFAKGKELDKKLREAFGKLDELQGKLGSALGAWRKDHPVDGSTMEEGEKAARAALDDARDVFVMVAFKKADGDAYKAALDKLDKSIGALKAYADGHATDAWSKIMSGPFDAFAKTLKDNKPTADKTFEPEAFLNLVTNFTGLVEARQRAVSRASMAKPPAAPPGSAAPGATPPAPAPEQPAPPH
jgi:hypothetical protein